MTRFDGKVVVLTGAARGLGQATARLLADRGACLALVDIRREEVETLATQLGGSARAFYADLAQVADIRALVGEIVEHFGGVDVLINNAAVCPRIPFEASTERDWERLMSVNAKSQFFLMQAVCPIMRERGGGRIVNVISASGQFGAVANASIYSGTKGAIVAFSKSVAREVVADGIVVNCFSPGTMRTDLITNLSDEQQEQVRQMIPLGRFATAEEMAVNLAFVASDECAFTTGATFDFIGGVLMR
ncbi:MAG: SDR family oxidoreductase [bacterium]|nr:SDR family oxidoreductase [bacterium]